MKKFIIEKEYKGYTIAKYLKEVQDYSGRSIRNMKFILDNKEVRSDKKLRPKSRLKVIEKLKETNIEPIPMNLEIVFEDSELLIINKPPFLVLHPTLKKVDKTLANGIVNYILEKTGVIAVPRFYNRLDMNTSGLIVITKTAFAQAFLQEKVDVKKKTTTVTWIADRTNIENIKTMIANAGYDADDVTADEDAYKRLPACCKKPEEAVKE